MMKRISTFATALTSFRMLVTAMLFTGMGFTFTANAGSATYTGGAATSGCFTTSVPNGATNLTFTLTMASTLDMDLHYRAAGCPTTATYDCRPYAGLGTTEVCGPYTVGGTLGGCTNFYSFANFYSGTGSWTLTVTWTDPYGVAAEGNTTPNTAAVNCTPGSYGVGSGAYRSITIAASSYYNFSVGAFPADISQVQIVPNTTTGNTGTITLSAGGSTTGWYSGSATSVTLQASRSSCTWVATSAVLTYSNPAPTSAGTVTQSPASGGTVCNGSPVTYTASGFTGGNFSYFEYQWNGTGGYSGPWIASNPATWNSGQNGASVLYVRSAISNNGCIVNSAPVNVTVQSTVNNPGTITAPASICVGGSATISQLTAATTGTPASTGPFYDYYWQNTAIGTWNSFQTGNGNTTAPLPTAVTNTPGTYLLARNSYWGCTGEVSAPFLNFTVYDNQTMSLTGGVASPTLCKSSTLATNTVYTFGGGANSASITSGSLPSGMTGAVSGSTFVISGTPNVTGSFPYTVTSSGPGSCSPVSLSGTITVNALPTPGVTVTESSGTTANDGITCSGASVTLTGTGGTSYSWGTPISSTGNPKTVAPTSTTTYGVTVTDANTCSASTSKTITVNSNPVVTAPTVTQPLCDGTNGTIVVNSTGADQYSINNGASYVGTTSFSVAEGSSNNIVVKLASTACTTAYSSNPVLINDPTPVVSTASGTNASCPGGTGSITFTAASGGTGPYTYGVDGTYQTGLTFTGLSASTLGTSHTVTVKDNLGCTKPASPSTITLTSPTALASSATGTNPTCNGTSTGSITFGTTTGGTAPYQYSINGGVSWSSSNTFTGLPAGTYALKVRDAIPCTALTLANITLTDPAALVISAVTPTNPSCFGYTNGQIAITASGGTGVISFSKDNGLNYGGQPITGLGAGSYTIVVRDANLCTKVYTSNPVVLTQPAAVTASLAYESCPGVNGNTTVKIAASGGSSPYSYRKIPGGFGPSNTFAVANGSSGVFFDVMDNPGCSSNIYTYNATTSNPTSISSVSALGKTCSSNAENRDLYLVDSTNTSNAILVINDNGNNLGSISSAMYRHKINFTVTSTHGNPEAALDRNWVVNAAIQPTSAISLKLPFQQVEFDTLQAVALRTHHWPDNVPTLADLKATRYKGPNEDSVYNTAGYTVLAQLAQASNGTILSNLYIQVSTPGTSEYWLNNEVAGVPLPVKMLYLTATALDNSIKLDWATASEINNKEFQIERSINGTDFTSIGIVAGNGNSNTTINYSFDDNTAARNTTYYYRLKQIDVDGKFEYSSIVSAILNGETTRAIAVWPNPTSGKVNLFIPEQDGKVTILCTDLVGHVLYTNCCESNSHYEIPSDSFASGTYLISVKGSNTTQTIKFVKN